MGFSRREEKEETMRIARTRETNAEATWQARWIRLAALSLAFSGLSACAGDEEGGLEEDALDEVESESSTPGSSDSAGDESKPADVEIESFARDAAISPAEAAERLSWQAAVPDLGMLAAHRIGTAFGGVWVDPADGDRVKVGLVTSGPATGGLAAGAPGWAALQKELNLADGDSPVGSDLASLLKRPAASPLDTAAQIRQAAADAVAEMGLSAATDLVEVSRSWAELESANDWLVLEIEKLGAESRLITGIRTDLNAIELELPRGVAPSGPILALIKAGRERLQDGLLVSDYEGSVEPGACRYPWCDPPLRGGIRILNGGFHCTGGFVARSKVNSAMYQFTAGHCVDEGLSDTWSTIFTNFSVHAIGPRHNSLFGRNGDMAILRINNVLGWRPENWVHVTAGPDTTPNQAYTISSERSSAVGMRICSSGAALGRTDCGRVTQVGSSLSYGGRLVTGLGRASTCNGKGDSGAPMYAQHVAYGLFVAFRKPQCDNFYQGILGAELRMNVNVIH
jgi:hypothetical protein